MLYAFHNHHPSTIYSQPRAQGCNSVEAGTSAKGTYATILKSSLSAVFYE